MVGIKNWYKTSTGKNYHCWNKKDMRKGNYHSIWVCAKKEMGRFVTFKGVGGHDGGSSILGYSKNITNAKKKALQYMKEHDDEYR
jgi:hypothetical protein